MALLERSTVAKALILALWTWWLYPGLILAQPITQPGSVAIEDEGVNQGRARSLNFTGTGVTASVSASEATINIPSGTADPLIIPGKTTATAPTAAGSIARLTDGGAIGALVMGDGTNANCDLAKTLKWHVITCPPYNAIGNDATDAITAIQAAITAAGTGGTVVIPQGTFKISATLLAQGLSNFRLIGFGNGSVLKWYGNATDPALKIYGTRDSSFGHFRILSSATFPLNTGVRQETLTGFTTTTNKFDSVTIDGTNEGGLAKGFTTVAGTGGDNNNDLHTWINSRVIWYSTAGWSIEHGQSRGHKLYSAVANSGGGTHLTTAVGIKTGATGGSFSVWGLNLGSNLIDVNLGNSSDEILIDGALSEGSKQFVTTGGPSGSQFPVTISNSIFAVTNMTAGTDIITYQFAGPLTLIGNSFTGAYSTVGINYSTSVGTALEHGSFTAIGNSIATTLSSPWSGRRPTAGFSNITQAADTGWLQVPNTFWGSVLGNGIKVDPVGTWTYPATNTLNQFFAGSANIITDTAATANPQVDFAGNAYYASGWKRLVTGLAHNIDMYNGSITFQRAVNGVAASAITWINTWIIDGSSNLFAGIDNNADIGAPAANRPRTGYFGTSLIAPTINATTGFQVGGAALNFSHLAGATSDTQVPNLNTLSTGLTVSRCVETDATGLLVSAAGVCGTGGSGDNVTVNGVAAADADFDDATPAAPANAVNVKWQKDALSPNNLSAHLLLTDIDGAGIAVSGSELMTASQEAGFLADGGVTALTAGAGNGGKMQVMDNGDLQYTDGAATPTLQTALRSGGPLGTPSSGTATNLTGTAAGLTAGAATALAANGSNCAAGQAAGGVSAAGAAEDCTVYLQSVTAHNVLSATHGDSAAGTVVLGDLIHGNVSPAWARLAGNITTTKKYLSQTGTGAASAVPSWDQIAFSELSGAASGTQGGTGQITSTQGDLLFGAAGNTWSKLAKNASATRYLSNTGTANDPTWAQIELTNGVIGILPGANGGTGSGFTAFTGPTTSLKIFTLPDASATILTTNAPVTIGQGGTGTGSTLIGLVRGSATAMTAAELSGDVTTSGSNATTIAANAVTAAKSAVVMTRRTCTIVVGADNGSALVDADLGPQRTQCKIAQASTAVEIDVSADAGTPSIIVGRRRCTTFTAGVCSAWTVVNLTSAALAAPTGGFEACSKTTAVTGLDGGTTCSGTLQNTALNAGDWLELVSGTAGGTAKRMSISVISTVD